MATKKKTQPAKSEALTKFESLTLPRLHWTGAITSKVSYAEADSVLVGVKDALKQIKAQEKEVTDPLNKVVKIVRARAKEFAAPFEAMKTEIERAMLSFAAAEQAKQVKAVEKEAKKLERQGASQMAYDLRKQAADEPVLDGASTTQSIRRARIVDMKMFLQAVADGGIATEVLHEIFEKTLNAMARAGVPPLPGIEHYDHKFVRTKGVSE